MSLEEFQQAIKEERKKLCARSEASVVATVDSDRQGRQEIPMGVQENN